MSKANEMFLQIQEELQNLKTQVIDGELSNLDALLRMREAKNNAEKILETVKDFENERINEIANEAQSYGNVYCGFEIKQVNGRETYSFKGIQQIEKLEHDKKVLEDKFKTAHKGVIKGVVQTTVVEDVTYWIDENGELQPLPDFNIGKSYLTVKEKK